MIIIIASLVLVSCIAVGLAYFKLPDYIIDAAKVFMLGSMMIDFPFGTLSYSCVIFVKQYMKQRIPIEPEPRQQLIKPENPQASGLEFANVDSEPYMLRNNESTQQLALQNKLQQQLQIDIERTVVISTGENSKTKQISGLISRFNNDRANRGDIVVYENSQDQARMRRPHNSIPFKIGDLSSIKESTKDLEEEIKYKEIDYGTYLPIIVIGSVPLLDNPYLQALSIIAYGIILHRVLYRESMLTVNYCLVVLLNLVLACGIFASSYFLNKKEIISGALVFLLLETDVFIQALMLNIPFLINLI